jgi:hypothetical protein
MRSRGQSRESRGPWRGLLVSVAMLLVSAGCTTPRSRPAEDARILEVEFDPSEVWSSVRQAQSTRLAALATFSSAGTTTIRFTDEVEQVRTEQVELRVWRVSPDRAAIRLSKVGAAFLLAGWNGPRWWVLDESSDTTMLRVRGLDGVRPGQGAEALLAPPVLLAMIGLLPWPAEVPEGLEAIRTDDEGRVVGVRFELPRIAWPTSDGDDLTIPGRMQVEIDRFEQGPRRVRILDHGGVVLIESELGRMESVETRGLAPGAWPILPHRVKVRRWNGDEISVGLDVPLAGGEVSDRLFDLELLRSRHADAIVDDPEAAP